MFEKLHIAPRVVLDYPPPPSDLTFEYITIPLDARVTSY